MYIRAIKITKDVASIKVAYDKDGKYFVRTGEDGFKKGVQIHGTPNDLVTTWGFRKVEDAPFFYDGEEIAENIHKFQMDNKGKIHYHS